MKKTKTKTKKHRPFVNGGPKDHNDADWRAQAYRRPDGVIQCPVAFAPGYGYGQQVGGNTAQRGSRFTKDYSMVNL